MAREDAERKSATAPAKRRWRLLCMSLLFVFLLHGMNLAVAAVCAHVRDEGFWSTYLIWSMLPHVYLLLLLRALRLVDLGPEHFAACFAALEIALAAWLLWRMARPP